MNFGDGFWFGAGKAIAELLLALAIVVLAYGAFFGFFRVLVLVERVQDWWRRRRQP